MHDILQAIILGIVQGITEWLPVSSSGHLVLFHNLFNFQQPVIYDIFLHLGSLIVILAVFFKEIIDLIKGLIKGNKEDYIYLIKMVIASIPIALVGFFLNEQIKLIFNNLYTVGFSLLFTSLLLFLTKRKKKTKRSISYLNAIIIGFAQSLAILPGVSRSGSTVSSALIQGIDKKMAARFSFLIFIPAILGASLLELNNLTQISNIPALIIGTVVSIIVGFISLKLLLRIINKGKLYRFGWYCLILGLTVLAIAII